MKKGFTLVELLVTIIIIALLSGIGIISYQTIFSKGTDNYYNALESSVLLAGNDYFTDHRDLLPTEDYYREVTLKELIDNKYLEQTFDSKGNVCNDGKVYVYRENNKYAYEVCIKCEGRTSNGKYCKGESEKTITASGITSETSLPYNVNESYNNAQYANDENVIVTLSTNNISLKIESYEAINQKTDEKKSCLVEANNTCDIEIDESGTYQVKSYSKDGKHQGTKYINVKILRTGPDFDITGKTNFLISENECSKNQKTKITYTIQKDNVNVEYKSLKYRITKENETPGDYKNSNSLTITDELESGHYTLEVEVEIFGTGESQKIKHNKEFNVTYNVKINYDDNTTGTHEVVKGKTYGYINTLPPDKTAWEIEHLEIKYYLNNEQIFDETEVTNSCTYEIEGKMAIPVPIPTVQKLESDYCQKELKYNGSEQTLTIGELDHVIFIDNKGTDASNYTVKAHVDIPKYIWDDGTTSDIEFTCSIGKATPIITLNYESGVIATTKVRIFNAIIKSGSDADATGTLGIRSGTTSVATVSPASKNLTATKDGVESGDITITGVDKGTSTITLSFTPTDTKNFNNATKTYTANVRNLVNVPSCKTGLVYSGSSQALIATGTGYALENNSRTSAGSQGVTVKISNLDTYAWSDNSQDDKTVNCSIASKITISFSLSGSTVTTTCKSEDDVIATMTAGSTTSNPNTNTKSINVSLSGTSYTVNVTCTSASGTTKTASKTYTKSASGSACGYSYNNGICRCYGTTGTTCDSSGCHTGTKSTSVACGERAYSYSTCKSTCESYNYFDTPSNTCSRSAKTCWHE